MKQLDRVTTGLINALKSSCSLQRREPTKCAGCPYVDAEKCDQLLLEALIELRRQTPHYVAKGRAPHSSYLWCGCPECKRIVQHGWVACPYCGQYLKWSDTDEPSEEVVLNGSDC